MSITLLHWQTTITKGKDDKRMSCIKISISMEKYWCGHVQRYCIAIWNHLKNDVYNLLRNTQVRSTIYRKCYHDIVYIATKYVIINNSTNITSDLFVFICIAVGYPTSIDIFLWYFCFVRLQGFGKRSSCSLWSYWWN